MLTQVEETDKSQVVSRRLAVVLCALPAAYFLLTTAYALGNFGEYGADLPRFLRYIAGPGILAAFFLAGAFLLSPRRGAYVGLTAWIILGALFLFELLMSIKLFIVMLGLMGNTDPKWSSLIARTGGLPPAYTVSKLNSELGITRLDQAILGGLPHKQVLLCSAGGRPVIFESDRFGFNNPDNLYDKPVETVVLGDSFVEGHCLDQGKTMLDRLRARRPHSVGLGKRGNGPLFELAVLGRFGAALKPKNVVIAFYEGNDWENLDKELKTPWLRPAMQPGADFGPTELPAAKIEKMNQVTRRWSKARMTSLEIFQRTQFVRNFAALNHTANVLGLAYPKVAPPQPAYARILGRAKALTASWGGKLAILYVPQVDRYQGLARQEFVYDQLHDQVLASASANGIPVIDLSREFHKSSDPAGLYADDAHLNAHGADVAARAIARWVSRGPPQRAEAHAPRRSTAL